MSDILPDARWDRLTLVCSYEESWLIHDRLQAWAGPVVPELRDRDDRQALVLARGDEIAQVWTFGRDRIDLCGRSTRGEVLVRDDSGISFTREPDGRWAAD
ncbi:hypothetical protein [Microbacterium rhizophilus]|uniref:hypothetical protein n=1 Tax=Microbacterium rhizophilus TaxID=3138934 RepID=UPI0031EA9B43